MSNQHKPAYRINGLDSSRENFYAIACDPDRNVVVEACAGAGKTWMLVSRILRALLEGAKPHEIVAITYTRKASGEMRERLSELLDQLAHPSTSDSDRVEALVQRGVPRSHAQALAPKVRALYDEVLESGRSVEVRTFHAWFAQLLRAAPREVLEELGLQPDMTIVEDIEDIQGDVFRRFHSAVRKDDDLRNDLRSLIRVRGRSQIRKWLEAAMGKRVEFELADSAGTLVTSVKTGAEQFPRFAGLAHPADAVMVDSVKQMFMGAAAEMGLSKNKTPQKAAAAIEMAFSSLSDSKDVVEALREAILTKQGTVKAHLGCNNLEEMGDLLESVKEASDQQEAHVEHCRMVRLARTLLTEYTAYKRMRGMADMADLEHCAQRLLSDVQLSGWVQERLDARIRHVLIDEFQDTSPLQWKSMASWLAGYAGAGGGMKAPSVFVVGDPKQSIYRFRRAEPRVFAAAKDFVRTALNGFVLECDHTRRLSPGVLDGMNDVFARAAQANEFQGFHIHTTEVQGGGDDEAGVYWIEPVVRPEKEKQTLEEILEWRSTLTQRRADPETVLRLEEATRVASAVKMLIDSGTAASDIMILSRKRSNLLHAQEALQKFGISYAEAESARLADAPEAQDLLAMMDVLASRKNDIALARVLRSPMFGSTNEALVWIKSNVCGGRSWMDALMHADLDAAPADVRQTLLWARSCFAKLGPMVFKLAPHDMLDAILSMTGYKEKVATSVRLENRPAALSAIDSLVSIALELEGGRFTTPYSFVRSLRAKAIKHTISGDAQAVRLLTIHGAKGLEAKVVFIMDTTPEGKRQETATILVDWDVDETAPSICAFVASMASCAPSLRTVREKEEHFNAREELNGLYVAMTRAEQKLILSCTQPRFNPKLKESWWERIAPVAKPFALQSVEPGAESALDEPVVLTELPGLTDRARKEADDCAVLTRMAIEDNENVRFGKAAHKVMEWATPTNDSEGASLDELGDLSLAACELCGLKPEDASRVSAWASGVLTSAAISKFVIGKLWTWAANEVPLNDGSKLLRIDRLVCFETNGGREWWILDYKTEKDPQANPENVRQVRTYMRLVEQMQPGDKVNAGFVDGSGNLIPVEKRVKEEVAEAF